MASLSEKVIIITGAGSGIGASTACHLAKYGASLALVGRRMDKLRGTVCQCQKEGLSSQQVLPLELDLLRQSDIEQIVPSVLQNFGRIDVLVNNAGVAIFADLQGTNMTDWDDMMTVNVRAPFLLTQLCLPHLIRSQGSVINVSSVQAQNGMPQCLAYSMSKAALDHFSRTLAADVGKYNVRINTVSPGFVASEIHLKCGMEPKVYQEYTELQKAITPLGRFPSTTDIASVIAFLVSDDAAFVTGETIRVDGGRGVAAPALHSLRPLAENDSEF